VNDSHTRRHGDKELGSEVVSPCLPVSLSPCLGKAAIILCGGESKRMGRDKATLPFGSDETMLQRVVRLVGAAVAADRILCVAAPGQWLPQLPAQVRVIYDPVPHLGPLAGLAAGLAAIEQEADVAYVTGCDMPFLEPAFVARMFDLLADYEIAAPHDGERWHPLSAVYRMNLRSQVEALRSAGIRSLVALIESSRTRRVAMSELRDVDPALLSLTAFNTPEEFQRAGERAI
jgi:molybdopterin-guanine dinucleotide biosynthesis protein A